MRIIATFRIRNKMIWNGCGWVWAMNDLIWQQKSDAQKALAFIRSIDQHREIKFFNQNKWK